MIPRRTRSQIIDTTRTIRYSNYGGIDISSSNDVISDFNTPGCLNMLPNNKGDLSTRYGVKSAYDLLNGVFSAPFEVFPYKTTGIAITSSGVVDIENPSVNLGSMGLPPYSGFEYNGKLYLLSKTEFKVWDDISLEDVINGPNSYIPTTFINTPASGGGTALEEENRASNKRYQEFQKEVSDTVFQFHLTDVTAFTVEKRDTTTGGWTALTGGFTQDLILGTVTPTTPAEIPNSVDLDGEDALRITGTKDLGLSSSIEKCYLSAIYGGKSNVSVWLSGNDDLPNYDFHSGVTKDGVTDPTYFPLNEFDIIGFDDQSIVGYQNQKDELVIYKYNSETKRGSTWVRNTEVTSSGVSFFHQELNSNNGCIQTGTIALVNNNAWALTNNGYGKITSIEALNENNIEIISDFINYNRNTSFSDITGLMENIPISVEQGMKAIDFRGKLYVSQFQQVWVCDYNNLILDQVSKKYLPQWYLLDNMHVSCWVILDGELHFGNYYGHVCKFKEDSDLDPFKDETFDTGSGLTPAIYEFYWTTKLTNLGTLQYKENVDEIYLSMQGYSDTILNLYTRSDLNNNYTLKDTFEIASFFFSTLTFSTFIFGGNLFPKTFRSRVKIKNAEYVQIKIGGSTGLPATLTSVEMNVSEGKEV